MTKVIINAAQKTPTAIAGNASFNFKRRVIATSAPVQAPVPGNGTATNKNNPINNAPTTFLAFFSPCSIINLKGFPNLSNLAKNKNAL